MVSPSSQKPLKFRRRVELAAATIAIVSTMIALMGLGEAFVRYREAYRTTVPGTIASLFYKHDQLGWALVRDFRYYGFMNVNAQGFRGTRNTEVDPAGRLRIMALGASTTFDSFVTGGDGSSWPAQLEGRLTGLVGARRIEVLNAGVPGYVLWQNTLRFHTELHQYRPDLVLLLHGHNELLRSLRSATQQSKPSNDRPGETAGSAAWKGWLIRHSMLYGKIIAKWEAIRWVNTGRSLAKHSALTPDAWNRVIEVASRDYERGLEMFLAVARIDSTPVALLEMVHVSGPLAVDEVDPAVRRRWMMTVPTAPVEVVLQAYRAYNAAAKRVAARNGVKLIEATAFGISGPTWYSEGDPIHFSTAGAERMASRLAPALLAAALVPRQSTH